MAKKGIKRRDFLKAMGSAALGGALATACQPRTVIVKEEVPVTQIVKETVKETVVVEGTPQVIEKEVTKVVEKVVTPTTAPIELISTQGVCVVWDVPNSVADMPEREIKEELFNDAYPDIDLQVDYFLGGSTDDFKMTAVTRMAAGEYPDALYFQDYGEWIIKGLIMPLDEFMNADDEIDWDDYLPVAQQACSYKGKVYRIPMTVNAWAWYYNKSMLEEYGIKLPEEYLAEDRWTWEDGFLELCQEATQGEGMTKTWGVNMGTSGYWGHDDMLNVIWSNGGAFFRDDPWRCALDEEESVVSLHYLLDLIDEYQVNPPMGAELPGGFQLEYTAMMYTGIWMLSSGAWRESYDTFGFENLGHIRSPYGHTGGSFNEGGGGGSMVTPMKAERPGTAWVWHKWNANEYIKNMISNYHVQAPAKKSLLEDPGYLNSFAPFESKEEWDYALETSRALPQPLNGSEAVNLIMAEWDRVKLGEITVEEMVDNVCPQVTELIKDTPV
jgi:ABC-type glycerol-3-phosphate transport system substrate-binding protein